MFQLLKKYVDAHVAEHGPADLDTSAPLYLDASNESIDGCCCLFFARGGETPLLVAKGARTTVGKAVFETEFATLTELDRLGMNRDRETTPRPLGLWREGDALVSLQTALAGTLMKNIPGRDLFSEERIDDSAGMVLDWWRQLQTAAGTPATRLDDEAYERHVRQPVERFQQRFVVPPAVADLLRSRYVDGRELHGVELPLMVRHADFCAANMTMQPGGVGVFDWEFPLDHHLPLFDLFFFFASLRYPFRGARGESSHFDSFQAVYWGDNYFNRATRRHLRRAADEFAVPTETLGDLFVLSLVQVANMKYEGFLNAHDIIETPTPGETVANDAKAAVWQRFRRPEKDVPFACIRASRLENLAVVVERGMPDFSSPD